jgi:hypothetical protein
MPGPTTVYKKTSGLQNDRKRDPVRLRPSLERGWAFFLTRLSPNDAL